MTPTFTYLNTALFVVLPYVALFTFFLVSIQRYRTRPFTYSTQSSQFLENRRHFWALVPFHYGIIVVLTGHVVAFFIPRQILAWNSHPLRLYVLEVSALVFGLLSVVGLVAIVVRRASDAKVKVVTSIPDWVVLGLLLVQIVGGVLVAVQYPWGTSWFAAAMAPYLWSLLWLQPDVATVTALPALVQLHIVNAFLLIGFFPFSRMVHVLVMPNPYLWRRPQVARWYGRRPTPVN